MSFFDTAYEGTPPWDLGRPQRTVVELERAGAIVGSVLDVGCGTGEHTLYLAERGHDVLGIDTARRAIDLARAKAAKRALDVEFRVWNALRVHKLGRRFDTALDVGLFHTLADDERAAYARGLRDALAPDGHAVLLCWSERNPWGYGPRHVTQMEILGTFEPLWDVEIRDSLLEAKLEGGSVHAWLARLTVR